MMITLDEYHAQLAEPALQWWSPPSATSSYLSYLFTTLQLQPKKQKDMRTRTTSTTEYHHFLTTPFSAFLRTSLLTFNCFTLFDLSFIRCCCSYSYSVLILSISIFLKLLLYLLFSHPLTYLHHISAPLYFVIIAPVQGASFVALEQKINRCCIKKGEERYLMTWSAYRRTV